MARTKQKPRTIDDYLAGVAPISAPLLRKLRETIHAAAPKTEECISYGIPALRSEWARSGFLRRMGESLLVLSRQFHDAEKISERSERFSNYKGTIRFSPDNPLPLRW